MRRAVLGDAVRCGFKHEAEPKSALACRVSSSMRCRASASAFSASILADASASAVACAAAHACSSIRFWPRSSSASHAAESRSDCNAQSKGQPIDGPYPRLGVHLGLSKCTQVVQTNAASSVHPFRYTNAS